MQHDQSRAITGDTDDATRYVWVRCQGCGSGLWRRYEDRLEMPLTIRGGQKRVITVPLAAATVVKVVCEKCSATWTADADMRLEC